MLAIARKNYKKYYDRSENSLAVLNVPHIYGWESSGSYHGYGLAELALSQWREYFYGKYGYIVDNPNVGKEMTNVWKLGGGKTFKDFVVLATGKKLSVDSFLDDVTSSVGQIMKRSKSRIKILESMEEYKRPVHLNAKIRMVHGKKEIANNKKSFEDMAAKYKKWLEKMSKS